MGACINRHGVERSDNFYALLAECIDGEQVEIIPFRDREKW